MPLPPASKELDPFSRQLAAELVASRDTNRIVRAQALERLGMMRAYAAAPRLVECLRDSAPEVRRQAAQSLAWCGGRTELAALVAALADSDWMTRQAAAYALQNLTGMEIPFNALAPEEERQAKANVWKAWSAALKPGQIPDDLRTLSASNQADEVLRAVRGLGTLGGSGASRLIRETLIRTEAWSVPVLSCYSRAGLFRSSPPPVDLDQTPVAIQQAGLRGLGRLKDPDDFDFLIDRLKRSPWTPYAADALGEWGNADAVPTLLNALETMRIDRIGESKGEQSGSITDPGAFFILSALCRLPLSDTDRRQLQSLAWKILATTPVVYDRGTELEPHAVHLYASYLLKQAGLFEPLAITMLDLAEKKPLAPLGEQCAQAAKRFFPSALGWLCADAKFASRLMGLLSNDDHMVRMMAAKSLVLAGYTPAGSTMGKLLGESKPDAEFGYNPIIRFEEYNDPAPRWRPIYARALGRLGTVDQAPVLIRMLNDDKNCIDSCYGAADGLGLMHSPEALAALQMAAVSHPFHSVRILAREYLARNGMDWEQAAPVSTPPPQPTESARPNPAPALVPGQVPEQIAFIKGDLTIPGYCFMDPWRQIYGFTDSGPEYRAGRNVFVLRVADRAVKPLTTFSDGYVASLEVSYDGLRLLFSRRTEDNPWWQIYEMNADGSGLHPLTSGPYHHVNPNYLPDGRIVFSTTRLGHRDEYHGYPATGLAVMNPDGSDIQVVGINTGRDCEPAVLDDGRIALNRIDVFYGNMKVESTLYSMFPDGTGIQNDYGPERRHFWSDYAFNQRHQNWMWNPMDRYNACSLSQPQPLDGSGTLLCCTAFGLIAVGKNRSERFLHDPGWAVTTPFPLGAGKFLCAAAQRIQDPVGNGCYENNTNNLFTRLKFRTDVADYSHEVAKQLHADLGLYLFNSADGSLKEIYHDPEWASYEARPLVSRPTPPVLQTRYDRREATGVVQCKSVFESRDPRLAGRAKWIRIIASKQYLGRHHMHARPDAKRNNNYFRNLDWKNHNGSMGRILGNFPLASDGSFNLEVPADHLLQCQVLDGDRSPIGTQFVWFNIRPGQTRGCVGCHEKPSTTTLPRSFLAARQSPVKAFPTGQEFKYEALMTRRFDPFIPDTIEEALSLVGSYSHLARP